MSGRDPMTVGCGHERDLLSDRVWWLAFYGVPIATLLVTGGIGGWTRLTVAWPLALAVMGVACLANARRCGRVHCFFTGPFFLLLAAASLLYGLHLLPIGPNGWEVLGEGALVGAVVLSFAPERIWGPYFETRSDR